jgi:hypothetical protein
VAESSALRPLNQGASGGYAKQGGESRIPTRENCVLKKTGRREDVKPLINANRCLWVARRTFPRERCAPYQESFRRDAERDPRDAGATHRKAEFVPLISAFSAFDRLWGIFFSKWSIGMREWGSQTESDRIRLNQTKK